MSHHFPLSVTHTHPKRTFAERVFAPGDGAALIISVFEDPENLVAEVFAAAPDFLIISGV